MKNINQKENLPGKNNHLTNSEILLKNCGFSIDFFSEKSEFAYGIEKSAMKKVNSANGVVAIPLKEENYFDSNKKAYETEDKEDYLNRKKSPDYSEINECKNKLSYEKFKNTKFDKLISNINKEIKNPEKVIKAYQSRHKSKFCKVYEVNSYQLLEKNKDKLFHKCIFQGCQRTFSSAGWLKAHYKEHLKELSKSHYCQVFQQMVADELKKYEYLRNNQFNNFMFYPNINPSLNNNNFYHYNYNTFNYNNMNQFSNNITFQKQKKLSNSIWVKL